MTETTTNKSMTDLELLQAEEKSRAICQEALNRYLDFPTQHNGQILLQHLNQYPSDWMNGRIRDV